MNGTINPRLLIHGQSMIQHRYMTYANLLVVLYNKLLSTFSFRLHFYKPHSNSSNTLDMLELHATLLTPDLARYSSVHACELHKRSDFTSFQPKKLSSLFVLVFFD